MLAPLFSCSGHVTQLNGVSRGVAGSCKQSTLYRDFQPSGHFQHLASYQEDSGGIQEERAERHRIKNMYQTRESGKSSRFEAPEPKIPGFLGMGSHCYVGLSPSPPQIPPVGTPLPTEGEKKEEMDKSIPYSNLFSRVAVVVEQWSDEYQSWLPSTAATEAAAAAAAAAAEAAYFFIYFSIAAFRQLTSLFCSCAQSTDMGGLSGSPNQSIPQHTRATGRCG
ncbi:hypothetical protein E2C01_018097 [Portunus trituberculatus]|uniref:Uncharacterized protein n=1 Tax=Portunus trituberculatus TaxID=210409 RepID=A0A5B7DTM2_PORTR|nr:hypothetical protein [Portunus trituberculatus]